MKQTSTALAERHGDTAAAAMGVVADGLRIAEKSVGPGGDLLIRLSLAQVFFVSAIVKLSNWDNALYLAAHEYPVSWMSPVTAACLGGAIEFLGGILLAAGLATRFAVIALLVLTLVIQFSYQAFDSQLFWAMLFGWYLVRGAGPISLDRLLVHGLADTALPFAAALVRSGAALTRRVLPAYQLVLRVWLSATLLIAASGGNAALGQLLSLTTAQQIPASLAIVTAVLLLPGLAVRAAALLLMLTALGTQMGNPHLGGDLWWVIALALLVLHGPGILSVDALIERALKRRFPQLDGKPAFSLDGLPRVVIVGAGFGGLACAAKLRRARGQVTLVDRHNYHLFQPLLYHAATAALSPGDIAAPVRGLFRVVFNARVLLGEVTGVDTARQEVIVGTQRLGYDYLVLATGAAHSYFGKDEWSPFAPGLKRVEDATEVRRRILTAFERAEATDDEDERASLLTFPVVGGGPTGVELAGAIAELARFGMEKEFRRFDPAQARVLLVQSAPRILPTFP